MEHPQARRKASSSARGLLLLTVWLMLLLLQGQGPRGAAALRFVLDKTECWEHEVPYDGDEVRVSYVVIKSRSTWRFHNSNMGVNLVVEGPAGYQVHNSKNQDEEKFGFIAERSGLYKFCFSSPSHAHETVDFDVHVGYHIVSPDEEHIKDEHIEPLMMQIERLEESLYSIQFVQHWLLAQTDRQELVNQAMSRRFIYKAVLEAFALVGCSVLQVVLLRRLFERKRSFSRV